MTKLFVSLFFISLIIENAYAQNQRFKDILSIKGVRENPLIGYGLVIGLNGTGDNGGEVTNNSIKKMFKTLGLDPAKEVESKNIASVIVTAKLPPFSRVGNKIDITVSSIGSADSLAGGTLLVTPLKGGDGKVYAIASGALSIGGIKESTKIRTSGFIPSGATVERELDYNFDKKKSLRLSLNHADFTTAARIVKVINSELGGKYAEAKDSSTIDLLIPPSYSRSVVDLVAILENFQVETDQNAKIVINEKTGTLVMGGDIKIKEFALSHKDINIQINGESKGVGHLKQAASLKDFVNALNSLGVQTQDMISILDAMKKNGSLNAEIELI